MKKTLAAAAILGAFASSAFAANVNLYGSVSTGLVYTHTKAVDGESAKNEFGMESAWAGDSIFGLTGEEELGDGWKVGFALENEFESDTGRMAGAEDNKLFDSMAYLWVGNDTVKFAAGNLGGTLASAGGDFDLVGGFDPLEAAYGNGGMGLFATRDMAFDNAINAEVTPIDGLKVSFQMSLEGENNGSPADKVWSHQDHYYGLGASYENGPFAVSAVAERLKWSSDVTQKSASMYTLGVSWDFEVVKPMFMYQHSENLSLSNFCDGLFEDADNAEEAIKTDSVLLGATAPLGNGTLGASVQYAQVKFPDAEEDDEDKGTAWVFGVAYNYELSKRTNLYVAGVYSKGKKAFKEDSHVNNYQIGLGLNHTF